jgi:CSLREA domain-containing protein
MQRTFVSNTMLALASFGVLAMHALAPPARAVTFQVDSTEDGADANEGDGRCATDLETCTLRAAIQEANHLPGADVVLLPAGTYLIAREGEEEDRCLTGDLDVTSSISITGDGAATTIVDANHRDRAFDVRPTGAAVISGVTVRNGTANDGAGLRVAGGTLKVIESAVTHNHATDAGGGIANDAGVLMVVASTIAGNAAQNTGGGVENAGIATLRNATVSGNTADIGGGICNLGTATLNNATVTANTLTGIDNDGHLVVLNSLLADNSGPDCRGILTSQGFNLVRNATECDFDGDPSGNLINMDPHLDPLQDNGGPTFTHALAASSAALDAANPMTPAEDAAPGEDPACEATDQRGVVRPQGARCDIGAFEACDAAGSPGGAMLDGCVARCGDGIVDSDEECDDGSSNGTPEATCDATCRFVPPDDDDSGDDSGDDASDDASGDLPDPICGNAVHEKGEECDDGNRKDEDGCTSDCVLESPLTCDDEKDLCDEGACDPEDHYDALNCILETPVCFGETLPFGVVKRMERVRERLARAQDVDDDRYERKLVKKAIRTIRKADKVGQRAARKGKLSAECVTDLEDLLGKARDHCLNWRTAL